MRIAKLSSRGGKWEKREGGAIYDDNGRIVLTPASQDKNTQTPRGGSARKSACEWTSCAREGTMGKRRTSTTLQCKERPPSNAAGPKNVPGYPGRNQVEIRPSWST